MLANSSNTQQIVHFLCYSVVCLFARRKTQQTICGLSQSVAIEITANTHIQKQWGPVVDYNAHECLDKCTSYITLHKT